MAKRLTRKEYVDLYGPTVGDKLHLGDTGLVVEIEKDYNADCYGNEAVFGGGKTLRDGMGQAPGVTSAQGALDFVITNIVIIDPFYGVVKGDIGIKNGKIVGIGKAGNPDTMRITPGLIVSPNTHIISALLIAAMGLVIIFGYLNVTNMAHGSMMMAGGFAGFVLMQNIKLPFGIAIIGAFLITGLLGMVIEKLIIKRLYSKPTETILSTYAISIILTEAARMIWPLSQNVDMPIPGSLTIGGVVIPYYNIFVLVFAAVLLTLVLLMFKKTSFGKKLGSVTQNRTMTECLGIKTSTIDTLTFGLGAGLAGVAGCILAPTTGVSYGMGDTYLTDTFMTVVVGGIQSFAGTVVSSAIMGEGRTILAGFSNETWAKILVFLAVIVIIRLKPEGLFTKERR